MTKTWCVGGRHRSNTNNFIAYEKVNPELKNLLKLLKEPAVFAVVINHKFLLSKRHVVVMLLRKEDVKISIVCLCQIKHGLI